jgi:hypothetical protein
VENDGPDSAGDGGGEELKTIWSELSNELVLIDVMVVVDEGDVGVSAGSFLCSFFKSRSTLTSSCVWASGSIVASRRPCKCPRPQRNLLLRSFLAIRILKGVLSRRSRFPSPSSLPFRTIRAKSSSSSDFFPALLLPLPTPSPPPPPSSLVDDPEVCSIFPNIRSSQLY